MKLFSWLLGFNRNHKSKKVRIYKEVDEEKGINNNRKQKQTNWLANKFNIYGGSRLPEDPNELIKQGWKDVTHPDKKKNHNGSTYFNEKTKQKVNFDYGDDKLTGYKRKNHYHWKNNSFTSKKIDYYYDKYGNVCGKGSDNSHILPINKKRRK